MTVRGLLADGVRFIRLPHWEPQKYMELPLLADGGVGPWATVRDSAVFGDVKVPMLTLINDDEDRYEAALAPQPEQAE